jgi:transposase
MAGAGYTRVLVRYAGSMARYAQGGGLTAAQRERREQVRMDAAGRFARGESIRQVSKALRIGRRQVEKWRAAWRDGGIQALRSKGPASVPRLDRTQIARLKAELRRGPAAHGWDEEDQRWTLKRIRMLILRLFNVSYTPPGVWLLLHREGWSWQQPIHRAIERDEDAIEAWKAEVWPRAKAPRRPGTPGCASKTRQARG